MADERHDTDGALALADTPRPKGLRVISGGLDRNPEIPQKVVLSPEEKEKREKAMGRQFREMDSFIEGMRQNLEILREKKRQKGLEDKFEVPTENIRKTGKKKDDWKKEDWKEFGWNNENIENVGEHLNNICLELFGIGMKDEFIRNTLELMVVKGIKPDEILEGLTKERIQDLQERYSLRSAKDALLLICEKQFGLNGDDIRRFLFPHIYEEENNYAAQFHAMKNIEDWAWTIMFTNEAEWGLNGSKPLLRARMVHDKNGKHDKEKSGYFVDTTNMHRWLRSRERYRYEEDRDGPIDFWTKVDFLKAGNSFPIVQVFNQVQMFESRDGNMQYDDLYNIFLKEVWAFFELRQRDPAIQKVIGDDKEFPNAFIQMSEGNTYTKETYGKNLLAFMVTNPLHVQERFSKSGELPKYDNKFGSAWVHAFMAYYNIADFEQLQKVLGKDSNFFTRDGFLKAYQEVMQRKSGNTGESSYRATLDPATLKQFEKAFNEDGELKDPKAFIELLNFFPEYKFSENRMLTLRRMITNAISEIYDFDEEDEDSLNLAEVWAWSWLVYSGVTAKADYNTGYNSLSKIINSYEYRKKMFARGNSTGNPATLFIYKSFGEDFFSSIDTETFVESRDEKGNVVKDKKGNVMTHKLTPIEIFYDLVQTNLNHAEKRKPLKLSRDALKNQLKDMDESSPQFAEVEKALEEAEKKLSLFDKTEGKTHREVYTEKANQLEFDQRTESNYARNFLARGFKLYNDIIEDEDYDFSNYIEYSVFGARFKRKEFQHKIQEQIGRQARYFIDAYGVHDFSKLVRDRVINTKDTNATEFRTMTLGESMFGHELVDIPEFWKTAENGKVYVDKHTGRHIIDWHKVNDNKILLYKRWMLARIGGDLLAHKSLHFSDPDQPFALYNQVIDALESLPVEMLGHEFMNARDLRPGSRFFNKRDVEWLRKFSTTTQFQLLLLGIIQSYWGKDSKGLGIGDMITQFLRHSFATAA